MTDDQQVSRITNTAQSTPEAVGARILAEARAGNNTGAIERMEAAGQRELVNSDRLPADIQCRGQFEALGFTFGDPDPSDPLFMPATLPPGWKREGSDHAMWSYITDQHGRRRVAIFYKAAFYDRSAFMRLESLDWYVAQFVEYGAPPLIFDDEWATRSAVHKAMSTARDSELDEAAKFRGYAEHGSCRDEGNRADCLRIADEREAVAAKYDAAIAAFLKDAS